MFFSVRIFEGMGRGVVAEINFYKEELLMECEVLVLSEADTRILNSKTELQYYTFKYNETQDCLVLGLGEIFNHSDNPNVRYELREIDGRKMMCFIATRNIEFDEQLFIDYKADMNVNVNQYLENKSLY